MVHGERDAIVPVGHGRRRLAAANPPKAGHFVPAAGHNDLHAFGTAEAVIEFIRGHVGKWRKPIVFRRLNIETNFRFLFIK